MPKVRKRKSPIVLTAPVTKSTAAKSCRNTIRKYHVLLKQKKALEGSNELASLLILTKIEEELASLGGLERYQELSSLGQNEVRGGGSEKVLITWLKELDPPNTSADEAKIRLLEVGALKPDNYERCRSWIDCTPIDLHARHPQIREQDFLSMNLNENGEIWDVISLSLVLNFVPAPKDRGKMLLLAHEMLAPGGLLFLALPLPCVANSRYVTFDYLNMLMEFIGLSQVKEKWKKSSRMGYWLYRKSGPPGNIKSTYSFEKKTVLRTGQRNNFSIVLER